MKEGVLRLVPAAPLLARPAVQLLGFAAVLWASLIGVSTLYTKQHYVVDVIAGTLMAYIAYVVFLRSYPREVIAERDWRLAPLRALGVIGIFGIVVGCLWILYQARI